MSAADGGKTPESRIVWGPAADDAMTRQESDPHRQQLLAATRRALARLEEDPGQAGVRRQRFSNGLWAVPVSGNGEDWAILWEPNPDDAEEVLITYLGPAPGRG